MALEAVIFDVDGTLVDTNEAHVAAWVESFAACGYQVPADRVRVEVGKGGDQLVPSIVGEASDRADGDALRAGQKARFLATARSTSFRLFPGAEALLEALRKRGLRLALATSSGAEQLEAIMASAGVPGLPERVDVVVTKDDAERSKPAPDLVEAAVAELRCAPARCAMVGDTPWDAEACRRAGVACLGVETGYTDAAGLRRAGARAAWRDVAHLLADIDAALDHTPRESA